MKLPKALFEFFCVFPLLSLLVCFFSVFATSWALETPGLQGCDPQLPILFRFSKPIECLGIMQPNNWQLSNWMDVHCFGGNPTKYGVPHISTSGIYHGGWTETGIQNKEALFLVPVKVCQTQEAGFPYAWQVSKNEQLWKM